MFYHNLRRPRLATLHSPAPNPAARRRPYQSPSPVEPPALIVLDVVLHHAGLELPQAAARDSHRPHERGRQLPAGDWLEVPCSEFVGLGPFLVVVMSII